MQPLPWTYLGAQMVKCLLTRPRYNPWVVKIFCRRKWYSCLENPMDGGAW